MRTRKLNRGNKNFVGQALNQLRKQKCLKGKETVALLEKAGVKIDESRLSKIEGGHRYITDIELLAFSTIYDISVNEIFRMSLNI